MSVYVLRPSWALPALITGALFGATVVTLWTTAQSILSGSAPSAFLSGATFLVALVLWSFGLATVGAGLWAASEAAGRRSPSRAVLLGLIATFTVTVLLQIALSAGTVTSILNGRALVLDGQRTLYGWWMVLRDGWLMSLLGGAVGGLIWRIAYRRQDRRNRHRRRSERCSANMSHHRSGPGG